MATITAKEDYDANDGTVQITWETVTEADTGAAVRIGHLTDLCVQVVGSFGSGTIAMQGSNDNSNWFALTVPGGDACQFTAAGGALIVEEPKFIRVDGGAGTSTDVDVIVHAKRRRY